jgi:N-acylmannosamine kinase
VVIGGSIGLADGYLPRVQSYLAQEPSAYQTELSSARHQGNAGLLGAALWAQGNLS